MLHCANLYKSVFDEHIRISFGSIQQLSHQSHQSHQSIHSIMRDFFFHALFLTSTSGFAACEGTAKQNPQVQSFKIDLSEGVPRMLDLIKNTRLPNFPEYSGVGGSFGLNLDILKTLKDEWIHDYDWEKDQSYMNRYQCQHSCCSIPNKDVASTTSLPRSTVWISILFMKDLTIRMQYR
jgi:hypothetical protein